MNPTSSSDSDHAAASTHHHAPATATESSTSTSNSTFTSTPTSTSISTPTSIEELTQELKKSVMEMRETIKASHTCSEKALREAIDVSDSRWTTALREAIEVSETRSTVALREAMDTSDKRVEKALEYADRYVNNAWSCVSEGMHQKRRDHMFDLAMDMYRDIQSKKRQLDVRAAEACKMCTEEGSKLGIYPMIGIINGILTSCDSLKMKIINPVIIVIFLGVFFVYWSELVEKAKLELNEIYSKEFPALMTEVDACLSLVQEAKALGNQEQAQTEEPETGSKGKKLKKVKVDHLLETNLRKVQLCQTEETYLKKIKKLRILSAVTLLGLIFVLFLRDCWWPGSSKKCN